MKLFLKTVTAIAVMAVALTSQAYAEEVVTRAEFCAKMVSLYEEVTGGEIGGRVSFIDSKDVNVEKAAAINVVVGMGKNVFNPEGRLTREQAAVMIVRLTEAAGKSLPKEAAAFTDNGRISKWALDSVGRVQAAGIMVGTEKNNFLPKWGYTHEQAELTLLRLHNYILLSEISEQDAPLKELPPMAEVYSENDYVSRVLELINAERIKAGLPALVATEALHAAAGVRASELPISFSHYRPNGSICFTALDEHNIISNNRGENIAGNFRTPEQVVNAWMNSQNHRKYILSPDYTHLGVGLFTDTAGKRYWSLFFTG